MVKQFFGTDGIRGVAGEYPLDPLTVSCFGVALGEWAARHGSAPELVMGMDTRESGAWVAEHVAGGLDAAGVRVHLAGVVTTPGIAHLAKTGHYVAGLMISASHNPYQDNGLKVFDHSGFKLPDDDERRLEERILALRSDGSPPPPRSIPVEPDLDNSYLDHLSGTAPALQGLIVAVDCGNGAAFQLAPALFRRLGATVHTVSCEPDGRNINRGCGALHAENLRRHVLATGADVGVAFDGDADRAVFVSGTGKIVNGDGVLLLSGRDLLEKGKLTGDDGAPLVVATVMSNLGLERALAALGIQMLRTPVGDKYVLEEMLRRNAVLGGEQSGHIIFREFATTGDGMLTALQVFAVMRESGQDLDALTANLRIYPQTLINVRVQQKRPLAELAGAQAAIREAVKQFGDSGRVVVRLSGTEPLARVMIEGSDVSLVDRHSRLIAEAIRAELGG